MSDTDKRLFKAALQHSGSVPWEDRASPVARMISLVRRLFDVPLCLASFQQTGHPEALVCEGMDPDDVSFVRPFLNRVLDERVPLIIEDTKIHAHLGGKPLLLASSGIHFAVGVPLYMDAEVAGVLMILDWKPRPFSSDDTAQLVDVATVTEGQFRLQSWAEQQAANERELRSSWERLQAVVTERGRLDHRLLLTDRLASVGTLAAGVAHEVNNPLAYMLMNMDFVSEHLRKLRLEVSSRVGTGVDAAMLIPGTDPEELDDLRDALQEAREGAERVRKIVQDLRIFARGEDLERTSAVQLDDVLESAVGIVANEIRHHGVLRKEFGAVPLVQGNEARLAQVFVNLLLNASQALDEERLQENLIVIRTRTDKGGKAVAEIVDTGCGIPDKDLRRLFDPFFTTKTVGQGTGLGLSICYSIVQDMGGTIDVESVPGEGTTFRVTLPSVHGLETSAQKQPAAVPRACSILLVDDEAGLRRSVGRILGASCDLTAVGSAEEALALVEQRAFDVILCDLLMPGTTGMEMHAVLEERHPALASRMVFMTGGAFTAQARAFLEAGERRCLQKPFTPEELCAAIEEAEGRDT